MSKLSEDARLPQSDDVRALKQRLHQLQRETAIQVNALAEGAIRGCANAVPAPPATGSYTPGDFVRNSTPAELGAAGSRYVVEGWLYLSTGFVQKRFLTGN